MMNATVEILRYLLNSISNDNFSKNVRDKAIIALGFAGAFRRSELTKKGAEWLRRYFRVMILKGEHVTDERLTPQSVRLIVKHTAAKAGLSLDLTAHSLRSGFVTTAIRQGKTERSIMNQTGHKSTQALREYFELIVRLKDYYDGFSFDGYTRLYNPFSILQCLKKGELRNYWYESGSPSFIVEWMREHQILDPEEYRHIVINSNDFISVQEIEQADVASFLYQSGYLTIEKKEEQLLTLDYPNREVKNSLSSM